jgi:hypothetical protein
MSIHRFQLTVGCYATGVVLLYDLPLGLFKAPTKHDRVGDHDLLQKCEGKILLPVSLMGQCGAEDRRSEHLIVADQKNLDTEDNKEGHLLGCVQKA